MMTMARLFSGLMVWATVATAPAFAQQATGEASLNLVDRYAVSASQPMRLARTAGARPAQAAPTVQPDAPAVIQVTGDAGQTYRVRVPRFAPAGQEATVVEGVSIVSANVGDVSDTGVARLDAQGRDTLRVVGRLNVLGADAPGAVTALPLSIDYE